MRDDRRSLSRQNTANNAEIHELSESDLGKASGGWGVIVSLGNAVASAGKSDKGADLKSNILMTALPISL
jgi:hypothetical protein